MATEEQCLHAVSYCTLAARGLLDMDLPAVLAEFDRFDAIGPILDPTNWMRNRDAVKEKLELLRAALPLWRWAQEQKKKRPSPKCTGVSAGWCPIHGDCTCPQNPKSSWVNRDSPNCPLHSPHSQHARDEEELPT